MKITKRQLRRIIREAAGKIICPNCGHHNSAGVDKCSKCNHPRDEGNWKQVSKEGRESLLRRMIREAVATSQLQKGDKVMVSEDGLFRFAKTAPHTMRDLENKMHDALSKGTVGTVIMIAPGQGARVDFEGTALDVFEWMLEKV